MLNLNQGGVPMNRFFKISSYVLIAIFALALILFAMFAYGMATRGNVPKHEPGSVWYNEETGITLTADDDGVLGGKNVLGGKEYDLTVGYRAGSIFVDYSYDDTSFEETKYVTRSLFIGDYRLKKDKLIIRNIDHFENIGINEDKLVFVKK